jgi:hypothetical protein
MRTKRCTGAAGVVGFEVNVDRGRPVIVVVIRQEQTHDGENIRSSNAGFTRTHLTTFKFSFTMAARD